MKKDTMSVADIRQENASDKGQFSPTTNSCLNASPHAQWHAKEGQPLSNKQQGIKKKLQLCRGLKDPV